MYTAVLAQTASGDQKSKILYKGYCQIVLDVEIPSEEFAKLLDTFQDRQFNLEITAKTKEQILGVGKKVKNFEVQA